MALALRKKFDSNMSGKLSAADFEMYIQSCISTHETELQELQEKYPDLVDLYYSDHGGDWVATIRGEKEDLEAETKTELLEELQSALYRA